MSVSGTLDCIGLEELLQAELSAQGDGRLILRNGAHYAAIHLTEDGAYIVHPDVLEPDAILQSFVDRRAIDPEEIAAARRRHLTGMLLLDSLTETGVLPESELMEILAAEAEDTFLDLMLWEEGRFVFERGRVEPHERSLLGRICVDTDGLCERATRRIADRRAYAELLGVNALLFVSQAGALPELESPEDILHGVYARLNGVATTHEVALQLRVGRFDVLRAVARLTQAGLARPARPEELVQQATQRADAGNHAVARALLLQWAELEPTEEGPLRKLASLAAEARDTQAEIEALCALGNQCLQRGEPLQAVEVFTRAMRKAPADEVVMAGLKLASEAAGDNDSLVDGTLLVAQTKIDEGDAASALEMLVPLLDTYPENMALHLLHARSLVMLEKRSELLEQAEIVGQVLGRDRTLSQSDKEAVEFFKTAIADVAPDRGDLLERFRALYDPRRARRQRLAITFAMILLICSAGIYFWPASAAGLLEQAQEAADAGDPERAGELLAELTSRFPDAPEMHDAILLQNRLFPPTGGGAPGARAAQALRKAVAKHLETVSPALEHLPAQTAQQTLRGLLDLLEGSSDAKARAQALRPVHEPLATAARRLNREGVARMNLLAQAAGLHEEYRHDAERLGAYVREADAQRDATWIADLQASAELLKLLSRDGGPETLGMATRELTKTAGALEQTAAFYDEHAVACRLTLAGLEIEEADRRCREDAPKLMVAGRLEQADALYRRLEVLIDRCNNEETYAPLRESLARRQIPTFVADRRAQIADIRTRLRSAEAAEAEGDLAAAVSTYALLIKEYWLIRFENIFSLPMRIETVPAGAAVYLNDELVGHAPTVIRYPWGSEARLRVSADGWKDADLELATAEETPFHRMDLRLEPTPLWRCEGSGRGTVGGVRLDSGILRADRSGFVALHDATSGVQRWIVQTESLEGVRGRPAVAGGVIYVPRVDGQVVLLDPADGRALGTREIPRPTGDMAASGSTAAVATSSGELIAFRNKAEAYRRSLGGAPTAGLRAAHGAFWAGTARGRIVRIEAATGERRETEVAGGNVPIAALVPTPAGMLATTAAGNLLRLAPNGDLVWHADDIGGLVGAPALVDGRVAVALPSGTVRLFSLATGSRTGTLEMGKGAWHGLLGSGSVLVATRTDGSLWAFDVARNTRIADVPMGLGRHVPPSLIDPEHLLLGLKGGCVGLVRIPALPPAPRAEAEADGR